MIAKELGMKNKLYVLGLSALIISLVLTGCDLFGETASVPDLAKWLPFADGTKDIEDTTNINLIFNRSVNLTAQDITISNGTGTGGGSAVKGLLSGSDFSWNLAITVITQGTIMVSVNADNIESGPYPVEVFKSIILEELVISITDVPEGITGAKIGLIDDLDKPPIFTSEAVFDSGKLEFSFEEGKVLIGDYYMEIEIGASPNIERWYYTADNNVTSVPADFRLFSIEEEAVSISFSHFRRVTAPKGIRIDDVDVSIFSSSAILSLVNTENGNPAAVSGEQIINTSGDKTIVVVMLMMPGAASSNQWAGSGAFHISFDVEIGGVSRRYWYMDGANRETVNFDPHVAVVDLSFSKFVQEPS